MTEISITLDLTRHRIRRSIFAAMRELNEVQGIENRAIIAELLSIASEAVSKSEIKINEFTVPDLNTDESEFDDEQDDEHDDEEEEKWGGSGMRKFWKTDIHKKVESMAEECRRLVRLERYTELVKLNEKLLFQLTGHLDMWAKLVGNQKYSDYNHYFFPDNLMRAYVVLLERDKLEHVKNSVLGFNAITKFVDQEIFEKDYDRFEKDIDVMAAIYEFLRENPMFPQKKLFSTLSIPGRQSVYMLEWAENLNRIKRLRSKDTWLLSLVVEP